MTNRFSLALTGLVTVLVAAEPALAKPILTSPGAIAAAGPAAAAGTNVVRYGKYYEDRVSANCGANYINCIVAFSKLPDTRHVHFTRVACAGTSSNTPISLSLGNNGTTASPARSVPLPVAPATYAQQIFGTKYLYYTNINQEIDIIMQKGSVPYVNFYANGPNAFEILSITCTLTGEIV